MSTKAYELLGGPQDGGKVPEIGGTIPATIYVGPKWLGDGYVTWGRVRSDRFPSRYDKDQAIFRFDPQPPE